MEGLGVEQGKTADDVGQHVLHRQRYRQGQNAGHGDDAGDVDAQTGGHHQAQQQIHHHGHQGADQAVGRLLQLGGIQHLTDDGLDHPDHQQTHRQDQHRRQNGFNGIFSQKIRQFVDLTSYINLFRHNVSPFRIFF